MWILDAHLDLSMNAIDWNRDIRLPLDELRRRERGAFDQKDRARATVTLPEMRRAGVGVCVATLIARYVKPGNPLPGWKSPEQAYAQTRAQLAWYRLMEEQGELRQIRTREDFDVSVAAWEAGGSDPRPISYVLSLEGADSILTPDHLARHWDDGLRAIGPAHYGPGTYAQGTAAAGGIGEKGRDLLKAMDALGMILDATHLCDDSFHEALDAFEGPVWASHNNCRALVPDDRQFSDAQLRRLIERGAVIGAALDAWMMVPGWVRKLTTPEGSGLRLEAMCDHMDHICQLAGNARHVGIGTDLDGGYGFEQTPGDLDSIHDLNRLPDMLRRRGWTETDIAGALHGNFSRFLREHLPAN